MATADQNTGRQTIKGVFSSQNVQKIGNWHYCAPDYQQNVLDG